MKKLNFKLFISILGVISIPQIANCQATEEKAIEKVTFIPAYVLPFYSGPRKAGGPPETVAVATNFDKNLSSTKEENILEVRDAILKDNATITPMTMFVLSSRLYDVGLKDDAVFWFYAAKDRCIVTRTVGDPNVLAIALDACNSFITLLGNFINGYAFCNIDKQGKAFKDAAEWTSKNPYKALLNPVIPSPHKDREKVMKEAAANRIQQALKEESYFKDQANREKLIEGRKKNFMDLKYCD